MEVTKGVTPGRELSLHEKAMLEWKKGEFLGERRARGEALGDKADFAELAKPSSLRHYQSVY